MDDNNLTDISRAVDDDLFSISELPSVSNQNNRQRLLYKVDARNGDPYAFKTNSSKYCWNCLSPSHSVSTCKQAMNKKMIAANKLGHQPSFRKVKRGSRYHERTSDVKVGLLTPELRQALGITEEDVPEFITRMNTFGYPFGLLKRSIKSIYIEDSGNFSGANDSGEEGEIKDKAVIFDTTKFYTFPGFNSPVSNRESVDKLVPDYNPKNNVKRMREVFEKFNVKRRKVENEPKLVLNISSDSVPCSADVEDCVDGSEFGLSVNGSCSTPDSGLHEFHTHIGTPVLSRKTKNSRLPNMDKFSEGMGELVNFENPSNYTGNYMILKGTVEKFKKSGVCVNNTVSLKF